MQQRNGRRLVRCLAAAVAVMMALAPSRAAAQAPPRDAHTGRRVLWTTVGAGAGFGLGVYIGLAKFDDAIDSDRKVWTTAIVGAAIGGAIGWLLTRERPAGTRQRTSPSKGPLQLQPAQPGCFTIARPALLLPLDCRTPQPAPRDTRHKIDGSTTSLSAPDR